MKIFIDTGAFIALTDTTDQYHFKALDFAKHESSKYQQVTSNFVICETLNFLRTRASYEASITFGEKIRESKSINIIHISPLIENKAWDIFKQYKDKDFSFTDCTSFIVIESLKTNHVFGFDIHFKQFGLKLLPFL